jgi:predicted dehydrogenase
MQRIGIIGCGVIARHHIAQWRKLAVESAAFYDVVPAASQKFAADYGGVAFSNLDELLANVDVVDVCTPAFAHRDPILAAARAGIPIICEKPLSRHLADCDAILDACATAGVPIFVAHVVRFFPEFAKAKAVIDQGLIGPVGVIRTTRASQFPRPGYSFSAAHYADFRLSGGVVMDLAIHDIDFQRWCCGEVERVFARGLTFSGVEYRDHTLITLRFASGAVGHIEASWAHPPGQFRTRLEIAGPSGLIEWDSADPGPVQFALLDETSGQATRTQVSPMAPLDDPYCVELAHFLDCIDTGATPRVTAEDARMAVCVALAATESIRTNAPINVATFQEAAL